MSNRTSIQEANDFNSTYETIRLRFNHFAENNGLRDEINAFLVAKLENAEFDSKPYIVHAGVDLLSLVSSKVGFNVDFFHHGVDYINDKANYEKAVYLEKQQRIVSDKLMQTLNAILGGLTNQPSEAFALQKLFLNINPSFLDSSHYEEFQQLRGKAQLKADEYSYLQNAENHTLLTLCIENQNSVMNRVKELKIMQAGLSKFSVNSHADIRELLQQLEDQGIKVNEKLMNVLIQSQFMQKDIKTIISYLENNENQKLKQEQHEVNMANYQGLSDACGFVSELGNIVGSRDLIIMAQIANAGVKIHQATDQLLNASFVGTAILSPYMAIGMAALTIFSLFQKNNDPQKIMMKQLANIARQIQSLHQDMLLQFCRVNEKLNFIIEKILEGFGHLELSLHVYVESKLMQIQSEIATLTKITQTGFETLLSQDLFEQTQYIKDVKKNIISAHLKENEYETRMGKLSRFISEISCSTLFNGLVYEHLLNDNQGNTQQIIAIFSQQSSSILDGLLGLLVKFARDTLHINDLKQISPHSVAHPGLWQIALQAYSDLQKIYRAQFFYDPNGINTATFNKQGQELFTIFKVFSNNRKLYERLLNEIKTCAHKVEESIKKLSSKNNGPNQMARLIYEIPEKIKKSDKTKKIHAEFFQVEKLFSILSKNKNAVPKIFFDAQKFGIGYIEVHVHLPPTVRSRKHHDGEYGISKGGKTGLEITFVMGNQRIPLFIPQLSEKHHGHDLSKFYSHILMSNTKIQYTANTIEHMKNLISQNKIESKKNLALEMAKLLQDNTAYHQLLKLNHFLIAYLTYGGFSNTAIQKIKAYLLLENTAECFAYFAENNKINMEFPKIQITSLCELEQIRNLIYAEIEQEKKSSLMAHANSGLLVIDELAIVSKAIICIEKEFNHKPGQTYGEFFPKEENGKPKINNSQHPSVFFSL